MTKLLLTAGALAGIVLCDDLAVVERVAAAVQKIHDALLDGIMGKNKK